MAAQHSTQPVVQTLRHADAATWSADTAIPTPFGASTADRVRTVTVEGSHDTLGENFLTQLDNTSWGLPATVYGITTDPGSARHTFTPLPRDCTHWENAIVGLSLPDFDGVAYYEESSSDADDFQARELITYMRGDHDVRLADLGRGFEETESGPLTGRWLDALLRTAVDGPLAGRVPGWWLTLHMFTSTADAYILSGGALPAGWDALAGHAPGGSDAERVGAAWAAYLETGPDRENTAALTAHATAWQDYTDVLVPGPGPDLALTDESIGWFGGQAAMIAHAAGGGLTDTDRNFALAALLQAWQSFDPTWATARRLRKTLAEHDPHLAQAIQAEDHGAAGAIVVTHVGDLMTLWFEHGSGQRFAEELQAAGMPGKAARQLSSRYAAFHRQARTAADDGDWPAEISANARYIAAAALH